MTTTWSGSLRIVMAILIVLALVIPGYLHRSPWLVVLATPAFTVLYILGKWNAWKTGWHLGGMRMAVISVLTTLPIQLIVAGIFYLVGLGFSMLLGSSGPLSPLASGDLIMFVVLFVAALLGALAINTIEARAFEPAASTPSAPAAFGTDGLMAVDVELDIDPAPVTPETFYRSRAFWQPDTVFDALEKRGAAIAKPPKAASEAAISEAEARLGVRFPEGLRRLYRIRDGGYVGALFVPMRPDPGPVYDDWRGAFAIDYSSLDSLDRLRTVKDDYEGYEPDEIPANADRLVVLQARTGDVTALDYSAGGEPRVVLLDYNKDDPVDIAFETFDQFFAALRRERREATSANIEIFRTGPLSEVPEADRPTRFWGDDAHTYVNMAKYRDDGWQPKPKADDPLVAETETRLGLTLPVSLVALWKEKNGGTIAYRYWQTAKPDGGYGERDLSYMLMPMEYFATVADVSARIVYPDGEPTLADTIPGADKLVFLQARYDDAVLLDYRGGEPKVVIAKDFEYKGLENSVSIASFDALLERLRAFKPLR